MSIFSNFNIKSKIKEVCSKETVKNVFDYCKSKIIEQAETSFAGTEKKTNVDNAVIAFIKANIVSNNPLVNTLISILIEYVPVLTQCIYEYLKHYAEGLTEA